MKIGIDISQIVYQGTGVARFTEGLVNAILEYDRVNQWLFFFSSLRKNLDKELEAKILQKGHKLVKWKIPPTILSFICNDVHSHSISQFLNFLISFDFFITSDWTEPPLKINKATIVHDLVYLRYPQTVDKKIRQVQEKRLFWVKKESKIIFADSQSTKNDLINLLQINPDRIVVNYPGVTTLNPTRLKIEETLNRYNLKKKKFILTVGKIEPRKNLERLITAMKQLNNEKLNLVIVGPKGWSKENIKHQISLKQNKFASGQANIKYLGYIKDQELYCLYASCLFFIYPSIWEGFGYPIVEAMRLEAPVACSNTSSLKEIADEAALLFNPQDINDILEKMKILSENESLRKKLINKGKKRSQIFTWRHYYNTLIKTLAEKKG
ncbi:MAG: glycosyltransferase family 4 protein [Microgenomates group bacterium]